MSVSVTTPPPVTPGFGWRDVALAVALALVAGVVCYAAQWAPRDFGRTAPIWPANAIVLACLLRSPQRRWWLWLAAGFAGNFAADIAVGDSLTKSVFMSGCNMIEVAICGAAIARFIPDGFDPGRTRDLLVGALAAVGGTLASAVIAGSYNVIVRGGHFGIETTIWMLADLLGILILTPCLLIIADWRRFASARPPTPQSVLLVLAVVAVQALIFSQARYPLLFLAPMAALTAVMVLELLGAAVVVLATASLALAFTFTGHGPIMLAAAGWTERILLLQVFVAVCSILNLHVAAMHQNRRRQASELAAALARAERAAQVKSEFLANMSHEIRTPLTSILGFASLLAERDLGEEPGRYVQRVLSGSRNLLALVNDVLDFSKLEAGLLEIRPHVGSPVQGARDAVGMFSAQADQKGLALRLSCDGLPEHALADFDRIRQVLMNLVGNAVKFTHAGEVRLEAGYDASRSMLSFWVTDTGPGLGAEAQALLFKRFSQIDARLNRAHEGSGLGLAICKGLVEAMGGRIGVQSTPGEGATFWFEVPAPPAEPEAESASEALDLTAFVGLKVLLVDDNAANRELLRSLLTPLGVALTTADGGQAAIQLAHVQEFQLILMDLRMPGIDGWAAARAIRGAQGPNQATPMLAFSADITADDDTALAVFEGVVRKPIEMAELLFAIAHWTGSSAAPAPAAIAATVVKRPQRRR